MSPSRPVIGELTLFVYRECPCGNWCLTGEGAVAPVCPLCDARMLPLGTAQRDGVPKFGLTMKENREFRGLGVLGVLTNEITAANNLRRIQQLLGVHDAKVFHNPDPPKPYAAKGEVDSRD